MTTISNRRSFSIYIGAIIAIAVFANLVSQRLFFRWDLTKNKIYTLSESSRSLVGELDDRLLARAYFSDNLPGDLANSRSYLRDMLEEFRAYSGGKFHFEFFIPEDDEELALEAERYGIPPMQVQAIESDRVEIKNVWMGLALLYEDRREVIPVIQSTEGLEYDLAAAIKNLINAEKQTVGIVSGTPGQESGYQNLQSYLQQTYNVRFITMDTPVAPDVDLLFGSGVIDSIPVMDLFNLDQFIMSGRPLILSQCHMNISLEQAYGVQIESNLFDALEHYGIAIADNLLADRICNLVMVQQQQGIFRFQTSVEYPFFPLIRRFSENNDIVSGLQEVAMFFTSEVTAAIDSARRGSVWVDPLMYTSNNTGVVPGPFVSVIHENNPIFDQLNGPGRVVGALLTGVCTSFFDEDSLPDGATEFIPSTVDARIMVMGDSNFLLDGAGGTAEGNLNMALNAVDYLVGDEALIALRSRAVASSPLKELANATRRTLKWANILVPSLLIIATGLWRWSSSRRRRRILEEAYEK